MKPSQATLLSHTAQHCTQDEPWQATIYLVANMLETQNLAVTKRSHPHAEESPIFCCQLTHLVLASHTAVKITSQCKRVTTILLLPSILSSTGHQGFQLERWWCWHCWVYPSWVWCPGHVWRLCRCQLCQSETGSGRTHPQLWLGQQLSGVAGWCRSRQQLTAARHNIRIHICN